MPRHEYCTLFDSNYLPRALALCRSLERHDPDFLLRAVCMDDESRRLLTRLELPRLTLIDIREVERADPGLLEVRPTRTPWEYCWTATPAVCRFILGREPEIDVLTYLDADLSFSSSPQPLFDELGDGSVLLVPHRSRNDVTRPTGIYNVGWLSFRNDENGRGALDWWRERCLEWCFDRIEPDRFGDQKYLDDWPDRFAGVKVCTNPGAGVAPWNDDHFAEPIFYHHAGLRLYRGEAPSARLAGWSSQFFVNSEPVRLVWSLAAMPSDDVLELIWTPYVSRLAAAYAELREVGAPASLGMRPTPFREAVAPLRLRSRFRRPLASS